MNIVLIFPRMQYGEHSPPLGLGYLAAALERRGHAVSIIDLSFEKSFDFLEKRLDYVKPALVGITCQTTFAENAFRVASVCKKVIPQAVVVIGGPHPSIAPRQTMEESEADAAAIGEGEFLLVEIAERIAQGRPWADVPGIYHRHDGAIVFSGSRDVIKDLDGLAFPARHLFDKRYFDFPEVTMISSRGCPFNCSFCQPTLQQLFGKRVRLRTPENVVAEIEIILNAYPGKTIRFHDDTFTWDRAWVTNLCALIERRKLHFAWNCKSRIDVLDRELVCLLKRAGCQRLDLGVESGSQRMLTQVLNKGISVEKIKTVFGLCREEKMPTLAFIMVGCPTETPRDVLDTIRLLESIPFDGLHVSLFTPFPGTRIYDYARERDLICARSWSDYDFYASISLRSDYFTAEEILSMKETIEKGAHGGKFFRNPLWTLRYGAVHPRAFFRAIAGWMRLQWLKIMLFRKRNAPVKKRGV